MFENHHQQLFNHFKEPILGVRNDAIGFDAADTDVSLRITEETSAALVAHDTFTLPGPFASLVVATPKTTVLTVGTLAGPITLASDIAVAVSAMDELASVAVGGVFLLSCAARGVNVTCGGETELYLDTLQGSIASNQSLATLAVTTTEPTATVVFGPVRLSGASSNVFVPGATMGVTVGVLHGNVSVSLDGRDGATHPVSLAVGHLSGRIVSDTPLASLTVENTTSTSTVTVAGVGNLTGVAAGVIFRSNDTTTVVSASRVGCPSHDEAGCDTSTDTAVLAVDKGVSALTVAAIRSPPDFQVCADRAASSKAPRFIRHRRRSGAFLVARSTKEKEQSTCSFFHSVT